MHVRSPCHSVMDNWPIVRIDFTQQIRQIRFYQIKIDETVLS